MIILQPDEKILLMKRRHKVAFYLELLPVVFIAFLVIAIMLFFLVLKTPSLPEIVTKILPFLSGIGFKYLILFFLSSFLLVCWHIAFIIFSYYYLDRWIITNERTIHTELRGFFSRFDSSVSHDKIQDVTIDIHGFWPTIFKYGDLHIQTAGSFREFIFRQVPEPYKVKEILLKAKEEFESKMKEKFQSKEDLTKQII